MDIPLYISELLDEQDYVVIPGLGAFVSSYRPAKSDTLRKLMLPPYRVLSFYPEMKSNDGVLTGIIAQHHKIPLSQAARLLEKFTGDVIIRMEKGEKVEIGKFGYLYMENGELKFMPGVVSVEHPDFYGLLPVTMPEISNTPQHSQSPEQEEKKVRIPVWAGGIVLLLLVSLIVYLVFPVRNKNQVSNGSVPEKDTIPALQAQTAGLTDTTQLLPLGTEGSGTAADSAIMIAQHPRKGLYYTIGGSFRSSDNADEFFTKMSDKGKHPILLGKIGNFYLVALDTFLNANDAFIAADQYPPENRTTEIWVYHTK